MSNGEREALLRSAEELERQLEFREQRFRLLTGLSNEAVSIVADGTFIDVSPEFEAMFGYTRAELLGMSPSDVVAPESRELVSKNVGENREVGIGEYVEVIGLRKDGSRIFLQIKARALSYRGQVVRVTVLIDVTERKRAEAAELSATVVDEVIRTQEAMIATLSTPLLPISDRVVVMPLVGELNAGRAARVVEALVEGFFAKRASIAILDITGVRGVDASVADMLVRAAQAVQLLGGRMLVTGIAPEAARTFVEIGSDLGRMTTYGTLRQAVTHALEATGGERERSGRVITPSEKK